MFSPPSMEHNCYKFYSDENAPKWKGSLIAALQKVQRQVHPSLNAQENALDYIEKVILELLGMLCATQPHSVADVEERVQRTFPHPIDKWAMTDAANALEKGKKKSPLVLPVDKIHTLLIKEVLGYKVDSQVTLYIVAVLEYIAADILKLTGNYVKNIHHPEITCQDIKVAMCADKVLMDMFFQDDDSALAGVEEEPIYNRRGSLTYEEICKDLIHEETQYIRDLEMIIKVFRIPFVALFPQSKDLEVIFSNILDIHEFTLNMLSRFEDAMEMTDENQVLLFGSVFEEIAEAAEFDVYEKYVEDMLKPQSRERLRTLLQSSDVSSVLQGHGFKMAVKYVLPKLLLGPIYHCLSYFDVMRALKTMTQDDEDRESLEQAEGLLHQLKVEIERKCVAANLPKRNPGETSLRFRGRIGRQAALTKLNELKKSIDGWDAKDTGHRCNEFIMEGQLIKHTGKKQTERHVFLFDGLIILCKANLRRTSVTGPVGEYRLKEKFHMRKIEIFDRDDGDEIKNSFEIKLRDHPCIVLMAKSAEEKNNWMAAVISLLTRTMLDRLLDTRLAEEEKMTPLIPPSPDVYRFAEEDSENNIVFEENQDPQAESPLIKGGTLLKLVERLTYHMYADPKFVRTFLTTYRSICTPQELLDLLIERFNIPHPEVVEEDEPSKEPGHRTTREDLKRFRKEYSKPIQFRVLNVLRHWVDHHFYDFERDDTLLEKMNAFLDTVRGKAMRKWVESITKIVQRRLESPSGEREFIYSREPPAIEWHIAKDPKDYELMLLHPIEIARQVTLLEFDLYRAVKPSELVGSVWIKKDKAKTSPNLLKMIHFSTMFTFSMEKCILEAENFEERVAVVSRIIEIMLIFQELNNFNGVLEVVSALNSAPVYRLEHTFAELPHKLEKAFDEAKELNSDHFKKYMEKLRAINPPCVPFLGMYLTNILKTEEGNPDFLPNRPPGIINFSKRRKVAEITGEIQQYQNQPYCLKSESSIRQYFEELNPLESLSVKDLNEILYNKSLELEPRGAKAPIRFPRKTTYPLKSPGVKSQSTKHSTNTLRGNPTPLPAEPRSSFSFPRIPDEDTDQTTVSRGATPPTPSTPLTPPPIAALSHGSDNSIFAPVMIGGAGASGVIMPATSTSNMMLPPPTPTHVAPPGGDASMPPPLPPRTRKRETSIGELSPIRVQQAPDAPVLPPRGSEGFPPPLPPRRDLSHSSLPRAQSMSIPRPVQSHGLSATLPRRNSDREHINYNGAAGSVTPELPPKTYRYSHSRKQSS